MGLGERDLVARLLKQSILTLCREAVAYSNRLEVDGIICLTTDDQDQHVVKIHEFFDRANYSESENLPARSTPNEAATYHNESVPHENITERYTAFNTAKDKTEKDISHQVKLEVDDILIKHDPNVDRYSYTEVKEEDGNMKNLSIQDTKSNTQTCSDNFTYVDYTGLDDKKLSKSSATNILCKKCNSTLENVELFQVHNMTSHNHFTCLVCLATFTSRNNMKRHIRLHTGVKPYSCHKCPESFSRNDDFKRHLLKHTFQKPFRCALCKTGYSDRACVKSHMMKEHNSKVYHVCSQCGESYIDVVRFQQHKKLHSELQDYRCSICSFTGSNALMYNKHMLTHGPLKEYKCTHCNLSFSNPFMYTSHMKGHKGDEHVQKYTCCFCDMTLQSFEQFQRHEHTHVHSKQHVCEVCNKVFRYPSNLREHMLTHLSKSTYQIRNFTPASERDCNKHRLQKDGETVFTMTVKDESFGSDFGEMETDEENNNKINTDNDNSLENNDDMVDKEVISGCSDYWCAECSHGFGTERELQNHISNKHEGKDDTTIEEQVKDVYTVNHSKTIATKPYEDSSQLGTKHNYVYNEETVTDNRNNYKPFEDSTQTDNLHYNDYTEETTTDNSKCHNDSITNIVKTRILPNTHENNMEDELNTVTDAMRQVKDIQSKFGIKSIELCIKEGEDGVQDRVRPFKGDCKRDQEYIWPKLSIPINNLSGSAPKRSEPQLSVSLIGTKMKIQRTQYLSSVNQKDTEVSSFPTHSLNNDKRVLDDEVTSRTAISNQSNSCSMSSNLAKTTNNASKRISSTSLNLKVRNPGFERVVTPEVLFKTKAPFICEVCEETFKTFDDFHEHGVKVHRRFICSYCGKVFTSRPNRERHIRYHTGEKPYSCELCHASFLRGDDLKYHRTTKHADIKPFTCGACQTSFSLPKDLEKHLKIYPDHKL